MIEPKKWNHMIYELLMRDRAAVARRVHTSKDAGSNPAPAKMVLEPVFQKEISLRGATQLVGLASG